MAQHVVDLLEAVQIQEDQRDAAGPACRGQQGTVDPVEEQFPVGQFGQVVVRRAVGQLEVRGACFVTVLRHHRGRAVQRPAQCAELIAGRVVEALAEVPSAMRCCTHIIRRSGLRMSRSKQTPSRAAATSDVPVNSPLRTSV